MTSARSAAPPAAVDTFAEALASWLSAFTMPQELSAEMASACSAGAPWAAALAGTSVKRAGWPESEALAWGIAIGALAGALEAARRSLEANEEREEDAAEGESEAEGAAGQQDGEPVRTAAGPALPLLASDGLVAGAHEALSSLEPARLALAFDALAGTFGDGGPWRHLAAGWPRPAWPALVACGLTPAAAEDPDGPWHDLAEAWRGAFEGPGPRPASPIDAHPAADRDTAELLEFAARAASRPGAGGDDERF
jgi:hypothetical protein